jgi:hypothetical protein
VPGRDGVEGLAAVDRVNEAADVHLAIIHPGERAVALLPGGIQMFRRTDRSAKA